MSKPIIAVMLTRKEKGGFVFPAGYDAHYSNPAVWKGYISYKEDYIYAPSFPEIEKAYEEAGKKIYRPKNVEQPTAIPSSDKNDSSDVPVHTDSSIPDSEVEDKSEESVEDQETIVEDVKPDWREMSWIPLRTFAKQFTDEPIKNKEQAIEVCEQAEKEGRL